MTRLLRKRGAPKEENNETKKKVSKRTTKNENQQQAPEQALEQAIREETEAGADLENLTVAELKIRLSNYGKKISGKKSDLIKRLTQATQQEKNQEQQVRADPTTPQYETLTLGSITFLSFDWETLSLAGNIWEGKSNYEFQSGGIYYWEITVSGLEKQYQYEYTDLGLITPFSSSLPSSYEKFFINGLIGELTHQWHGPLRGIDSEKQEVRNTSTGIDLPHYRIRLKDGDTIGFLLNLSTDNERTLTMSPRRNYSCDPSKPHTQPVLAFSSQLLERWASSTISFGTLSVAGRIPPKVPLSAFASVGQLGKRFTTKFVPNLSEYLTVQKWKEREEGGEVRHAGDGNEEEQQERRVPPVAALERLLFSDPTTTLNTTTLSSRPYDPALLDQIERSEQANTCS
jgi:hypothetical protein